MNRTMTDIKIICVNASYMYCSGKSKLAHALSGHSTLKSLITTTSPALAAAPSAPTLPKQSPLPTSPISTVAVTSLPTKAGSKSPSKKALIKVWEEDQKANLEFEDRSKGGVTPVKGATIGCLIIYLVKLSAEAKMSQNREIQLIFQTFVSTAPSFIEPKEVIDILDSIYNMPEKEAKKLFGNSKEAKVSHSCVSHLIF
jgi:hypothetical protein